MKRDSSIAQIKADISHPRDMQSLPHSSVSLQVAHIATVLLLYMLKKHIPYIIYSSLERRKKKSDVRLKS